VQKANGRKWFVSFCATSAFLLAVTAKGKLRFAAYDGHLNGPVFIDLCRRLLHDNPGPVGSAAPV
jgi:hypothetical protein